MGQTNTNGTHLLQWIWSFHCGLSVLKLKSLQRSAVSTDAHILLYQEVARRRSFQYDWVFFRRRLFGGQTLAHKVFLQAQKQVDHLTRRGQARRVVVVQRVGGEQRLLLDSDLIEEAGVDQHHGVRHVGLFGTLGELQLWAIHYDGVPENW